MNEQEKEQFLNRQLILLSKVNELHNQLKDISISLEKLYPVTIVENDTFFVFDLDETYEKYELKIEHPTPMQTPKGVRAAFELDFYDMKPSAIVSEDVFSGLDGYAVIFHELVHCYQMESCENELRKTLEIERKAKKENNFMWEITHPFPYENSSFIKKVMELSSYLKQGEYIGVLNCNKDLRENLNKIDFEYMIWQEWKEGFARYIENLIRDRLGLSRKTDILQPPFDRVCFYEIGSKYIELLISKEKSLKDNIKDLYHRMYNTI